MLRPITTRKDLELEVHSLAASARKRQYSGHKSYMQVCMYVVRASAMRHTIAWKRAGLIVSLHSPEDTGCGTAM
jgi:hypothetical protein